MRAVGRGPKFVKFGGTISEFARSFCFATVTYTTLGYGEVVPAKNLRIFATFASITGLLSFGVSTAFVISIPTSLRQPQDAPGY